MKRSRLNPRGKKVKAWESARRQLKVKFEAANVTRCELCGTDDFLSFAHSKKRRHIQGDELNEVALLCIPCHQSAELLPEAEMTITIRRIIAERETQI